LPIKKALTIGKDSSKNRNQDGLSKKLSAMILIGKFKREAVIPKRRDVGSSPTAGALKPQERINLEAFLFYEVQISDKFLKNLFSPCLKTFTQYR
jgi:hypothetical protein